MLALDMGGTFIKSACVDDNGSLGDTIQTPSNASAGQDEILNALAQALCAARSQAQALGLTVGGIGVSTPGPFDYAGKRSLMRHKYQAVYGLDLQEALRTRGALSMGEALVFSQDANAFLAGEHAYGAAKGQDCCALVTLGTGLGFACMVDGVLLTNGRGSCYVALYKQPWQGGVIEDVVSGRGLCAAYRQRRPGAGELTAKQVCDRAREGDADALGVLNAFGQALGASLAFHLNHTGARLLVVGGQISKSFGLFEGALVRALRGQGCEALVCAAQHPEDAGLLGAGAQVL